MVIRRKLNEVVHMTSPKVNALAYLGWASSRDMQDGLVGISDGINVFPVVSKRINTLIRLPTLSRVCTLMIHRPDLYRERTI